MLEDKENPFAFPNTDGMTLRDYFAAKAMQAIIGTAMDRFSIDTVKLTETSYSLADEMLRQRKH